MCTHIPPPPPQEKEKDRREPSCHFPFFGSPGGGVFWVGGCSHMAMNLRGGGWVWIFSETIKSTSLGIIYHSCIPKNKLHFFHKGNNLRLGPSKYWSEICMKLSTHPWLVLLCMLTGKDGEKGLFAMQVGWFSVYLLKMCNTLYLKPLVHKTTCSSDDMGKFH